MKTVNKIYINGEFVTPHGTETLDLINPSNNVKIGELTLADEIDTRNAIAAAKEAFKNFSKSTVEERISYLKKLKTAVEKRKQDFTDIMIEEYGGTFQFSSMSNEFTGLWFDSMIESIRNFEFEQTINSSKVLLQPVGIVGIITPWNASNSSVCSKVATAIAAGCTVVIKPSEMSGLQTQILMEAFHDAGLPKGIINFVTGLGNVVGTELTIHPDVSKISFTGSTAVGKLIAKTAVDTMKRVTLELGGKSPNIILDDANLEEVVPTAIFGAYMNSGQACIAPTRLLVPENQIDKVNEIAKATAEKVVVGLPQNDDTNVGPMVSVKQFERVQNYIKIGLEEGAVVLAGGEADGFSSVISVVSGGKKKEYKSPELSLLPVFGADPAVPLDPSDAEAVSIGWKGKNYVVILAHRDIGDSCDLLTAGGVKGLGTVIVFDTEKQKVGGTVLHW